jgi:hypothetical protein
MLQNALPDYAETNDMVVVYPQTADGGGCWDWWGATGEAFDTHEGLQLKVVLNMMIDLPQLLGWQKNRTALASAKSVRRKFMAPEVVIPEVVMPEVVMPELVMPEVVMPELVMPEVVMPEVVMPELVMPELVTMKTMKKATRTTTISNTKPRLDQYGVPLNAHQGSLLQGLDKKYYYYGGHFPNCTYAVPNGTKGHCACADTGAQIWHSIAVYSSPDLQQWAFEREMFGPKGSGSEWGALEPRVVANRRTGQYVMIVKGSNVLPNCQLAVAVSADPTGPFVPKGCLNISQPLFSDWSVFADPSGTNSAGYIIYNSKNAAGQFIEQLTPDFTAVVKNTSASHSPTHIAEEECREGGCEAPLMFTRGGIYYALFGHNCWCCPEGSELYVFSAPTALGPYTYQSDANLNAAGDRVVHGQSTAVVPLSTTNGTQYLWLSDRWQSSNMWSTDLQYWGLLHFDDRGGIKPVVWEDSFQLDLLTH